MLKLVKKLLNRFKTRRQLRKLYHQLVENHGRRRFYRPRTVQSRFQLGGFQSHFHLWLAYAVFCSRSEFDKVCTGENNFTDYHALRSPFVCADTIAASASSWDGLDSGFGFGGGGDVIGGAGLGGDLGGGDGGGFI